MSLESNTVNTTTFLDSYSLVIPVTQFAGIQFNEHTKRKDENNTLDKHTNKRTGGHEKKKEKVDWVTVKNSNKG